jgi:hypothetical protein
MMDTTSFRGWLYGRPDSVTAGFAVVKGYKWMRCLDSSEMQMKNDVPAGGIEN